MNKLARLGLIFASSAAPLLTSAADDSDIEKITVVGAATNSVITASEIEIYQANDLADIFRLTPSVSVGGSVGIAQKIYIRGLEDAKLNITVDGAQQTSTLFHHIGRVTIDPDLLEQVEIQAGAGEATSGPGAIGGSIRFRTKDAIDLLRDEERIGGRLKISKFSNDGRRMSSTLYGKLSDSWGLLGYYSDVQRENMQDGDGNDILGTAADQNMTFLKLSGEISDSQRLSISYEERDEEGEFSARPNWVVQPDDQLYPSEGERQTLVANYGFAHSDLINVEVTAYQTESSFRGGRFDWLAEIDTFGFDIRNKSEMDQHVFTYGADYRDDRVDSGFAIPQPEEDHAEEGSVLGIYFQGHTDVTDSLLVSYGARYDDYQYEQKILLDDYYGDPITDAPVELDSSELSVNAGLSYAITEEWVLGLGYAEASRGKEIGDGFTIDSYLFDRSDAPVASSELVPETVSNIEASLEYSAKDVNAKLAVYQSDLDDVIFSGLSGNAQYENIGTVETSGFELDLLYTWGDFDVFLGLSSTDTQLVPRSGLYPVDYGSIDLNSYEYNGLGNSRGDTWVFGVDYTPNTDVKVGAVATRVDAITIETLHRDLSLYPNDLEGLYDLNKPDYTTVDIYAEWQATDNLTLNLVVTNLFDKLYRDQSSVGDYSEVPGYGLVVGPYEAGRDIRLSVSFDF